MLLEYDSAISDLLLPARHSRDHSSSQLVRHKRESSRKRERLGGGDGKRPVQVREEQRVQPVGSTIALDSLVLEMLHPLVQHSHLQNSMRKGLEITIPSVTENFIH